MPASLHEDSIEPKSSKLAAKIQSVVEKSEQSDYFDRCDIRPDLIVVILLIA